MKNNPKIERDTLEHTNILTFLKNFSHSGQILYLYPSHHPKVALSIETLHESCQNILKNRDTFSISTIKKDLLFNALPLEAPSADVKSLAAILYDNRISSITFTGQIDKDDLKKLMKIFSHKCRQINADDGLIEEINKAGISQIKLERINYKEIFSHNIGVMPDDCHGQEEKAPISSSLVDYLRGKAENFLQDSAPSGDSFLPQGNPSEEDSSLSEGDDLAACEIAQKPSSLRNFLQTMAGESDTPVDELVEMVERLGIYLEKFHHEDSNIYLKNLAEVICSLDSELRISILGHSLERCSRTRGSGNSTMEQFVKKMLENITLALVEENQNSSDELLSIFKKFTFFPDVASDLAPQMKEMKKSLGEMPSLSGETLSIFNELFVKSDGLKQEHSSYLEHIVKATEKDLESQQQTEINQNAEKYKKLITHSSLIQQFCRLQLDIIRFHEKGDQKESIKHALKETIISHYNNEDKENFIAVFEYLTSGKTILEYFIKELKGNDIIEDLLLNYHKLTPSVKERIAARLCKLRHITHYFIMNVLIKIDNEEQKLNFIQSLITSDILNTKSVSFFVHKLEGEQYDVLTNAVTILGCIKDNSIVNKLITILNHKEIEIVRATVKALGKIGSTEATLGLLTFLKKADELIVSDIIEVILAEPNEKIVISVLNTFLGRKSLSNICMEKAILRLLLAIGQCKVETAIPFIIDIYKNKEDIFQEPERAHYLTIEILKEIDTPKAHSVLKKIMKETSPASHNIFGKVWKGFIKPLSP